MYTSFKYDLIYHLKQGPVIARRGSILREYGPVFKACEILSSNLKRRVNYRYVRNETYVLLWVD